MREEKKVFRDWNNNKTHLLKKGRNGKIEEYNPMPEDEFVEFYNPKTGEVLEDYYISNHGDVIKVKKTGIELLIGDIKDKGYKRVEINDEKIYRHRAVFYSFAYRDIKDKKTRKPIKVYGEEDIEKPNELKKKAIEMIEHTEVLGAIAKDSKESLYVVHHKDFNRQNNDVENLILYKKTVHDDLHILDNEIKKIRKQAEKDQLQKDIEELQAVSRFTENNPSSDNKVSAIAAGDGKELYAKNINPSEKEIDILKKELLKMMKSAKIIETTEE